MLNLVSARGGTIVQTLDWGSLAPLRLRSRIVAEGVYAGLHRSARRGAGVEFGGHRPYEPGDDLRWIDRRSLLRHDRLLIRQFETETDRPLRLIVDATASMSYRGQEAKGAKLAFSSLIAAALARLALRTGDPFSLTLLGSRLGRPLPLMGGGEAFERLLASLESLDANGDARFDTGLLDRALTELARSARRGSFIVFLSDLLDLPDGATERIAALASRGKIVIVVQVLDPDEVSFPFKGTIRLRSLEGDLVVETDADATRTIYLERLGELTSKWQDALIRRGARFVRATTSDDPIHVVREIVGVAQ